MKEKRLFKGTYLPPDGFDSVFYRRKALLLDGINGNVADALIKLGFEVMTVNDISRQDLLDLMPNVRFLAVRSKTKITAEILEAGKSLIACGRGGAGLDSIDVKTASELGIICFACPGANAESVAEVALSHILTVLHKMPVGALGLNQGNWRKKECKGSSLFGKTVGLVGMGYVAKWLSKLLEPYNVRIISYDIDPAAALPWIPFVNDLSELLAESDIVSLHIPSSVETKGMFNNSLLSKFKPGATLINCARGDLVLPQAIIDSLESGQLGYYAADVFSPEPPNFSKDELFSRPDLIQSGRLYLTPHLAANSDQAQNNVADMLIEQFKRLFVYGEMPWGSNFPKFHLPKSGVRRLVVIHKDSQGVIAEISQYLSTFANIAGNVNRRIEPGGTAYTVFDLDKKVGRSQTELIEGIKGVLRAYVL